MIFMKTQHYRKRRYKIDANNFCEDVALVETWRIFFIPIYKKFTITAANY